ncbi:MAG: hypothetical protein U9M90_00525 [Patescibacteria group bacterium]|nr:hypothetical protein [Patescibacteria group bacterium]
MSDLNEKAITAIENFENEINSLGLPYILLRKLNSIRNAIEMHVEDYNVFPEVLECLFQAYIKQAKVFKEPHRSDIMNAFRKCKKEIRKSLIFKAEQRNSDLHKKPAQFC